MDGSVNCLHGGGCAGLFFLAGLPLAAFTFVVVVAFVFFDAAAAGFLVVVSIFFAGFLVAASVFFARAGDAAFLLAAAALAAFLAAGAFFLLVAAVVLLAASFAAAGAALRLAFSAAALELVDPSPSASRSWAFESGAAPKPRPRKVASTCERHNVDTPTPQQGPPQQAIHAQDLTPALVKLLQKSGAKRGVASAPGRRAATATTINERESRLAARHVRLF